ncbi:hypothetical protein B296_00037802 [Ensete ventricosum]|uniref:Uncharacterized protein n=1 Tax=Ensete ventricosum TaxID=4639 RepID=A0A426ZLF6_ENSVE|nr:hypothetical protein B296_00037802 [Ensete ventricosum]
MLRESLEACREFIGSSPKVSEAYQELAEGIRGLSGVRRKLAKGIKSLLGVHRELAKSNRELTRMTLGVHWKKTKRLIGRSSGLVEKLAGSQKDLVGLDGHMIVID